MLAADPDDHRGKSTTSSTRVAEAFFTNAERRDAKIHDSHRGFHDTKNGGFSTIDRLRRISYFRALMRPTPRVRIFSDFRKISQNFGPANSGKE
jgi:hypothetical protein